MPKGYNHQPGIDLVLDLMIEENRPLKRETYLMLAFQDRDLDPNQLLMPEEEQMLPEFLQLKNSE